MKNKTLKRLIKILIDEGIVSFVEDEKIFVIEESTENGFMIDTYDRNNIDPDDGGFCYGTEKEAIEFFL